MRCILQKASDQNDTLLQLPSEARRDLLLFEGF